MLSVCCLLLLAGLCAAVDEVMEEEERIHTASHAVCQKVCTPNIGDCVDQGKGYYVCIPKKTAAKKEMKAKKEMAPKKEKASKKEMKAPKKTKKPAEEPKTEEEVAELTERTWRLTSAVWSMAAGPTLPTVLPGPTGLT